MGDIIIGIILLSVVALAARSLWKNHKAGKSCGGCSGDCGSCHGCH